MKLTKLILSLFIPFFSFSQGTPFEIYGTIKGQYNSKVYLFFENNFRAKDSINAPIENGKFYFKATSPNLPVLARLHLDQNSHIADVFIEGGKVYINCTNSIIVQKNQNNTLDTTNVFRAVSVIGSKTESLKRSLESQLKQLDSANVSDDEKREGRYEKLIQFVKKYPQSRASAYLLTKASDLYFSQLKELSLLLDTSLNKTTEWQTLQKLLVRLDRSGFSRPGQPFHDFAFEDSSNMVTKLKNLHGKFTLVVLWASWCGPCRRDNPKLNKLYQQYKEQGVQIIGVSIDTDKAKWKSAIAKDKLLWPQVIDTNDDVSKYYGLEGVPQHFLLDENGKIIAKTDIPGVEEILKQRTL
jgi:peroxiredoxin